MKEAGIPKELLSWLGDDTTTRHSYKWEDRLSSTQRIQKRKAMIKELFVEDETDRRGERMKLNEEYDSCLVGLVGRYEIDPLVWCYSASMVIDTLKRKGKTKKQAEEFYKKFILNVWLGDGTPCFLY